MTTAKKKGTQLQKSLLAVLNPICEYLLDLFHEGRFAESAKIARQALQVYEASSGIQRRLRQALPRRMYDESMAIFKFLIKLEPAYSWAQQNWGIKVIQPFIFEVVVDG
jgi:hypothetical protein